MATVVSRQFRKVRVFFAETVLLCRLQVECTEQTGDLKVSSSVLSLIICVARGNDYHLFVLLSWLIFASPDARLNEIVALLAAA